MAARYASDVSAYAPAKAGATADAAGEVSGDLASAPDKTPDKKRFMFAYTNADVATLNAHARALHKERGDLGEDHALKTATGEQQFATGDRIQFTGNGRTKAEKLAGLTNGRVGTIAEIEILDDGKSRVTVDLDMRSGEKPQQVSFIVGEDAKAGEFDKFKHGYAGTIYRGQGRTLDEVYVGHSAHWRSSASYVALTRHREAVHIFAARETVKDLDAMAKGMERPDNKRAASAYSIDEASAARAGLDEAVAEYSERRAPPITATIDKAAIIEPATSLRQGFGGQADATPTTGAGHGVAELGNAAAGMAAGASRALDAVGDLAGKAIETLADTLAGLLGGGASAPSPAPTTKHEATAPTDSRAAAARGGAALDASPRAVARLWPRDSVTRPSETPRSNATEAASERGER